MVLSWIWTGIIALSILCARITGNGAALSGAVMEGAQAGIHLAVSLAGSICLWSGLGTLMGDIGLTRKLSRIFAPLLGRIFPSGKKDPLLADAISANFCANLLGLGNAATPMGVRAAKRIAQSSRTGAATHELCRLVVLNTASIQLIPGTVAALRASLGSASPFDILPAVWITSAASASLGLAAAWILGKLWPND